jgi:predicted RNA-binding protein with PUA-like domain
MRLTVRGGHLYFPDAAAMTHACWLMKSEPSECSIDDLAKARNQTVPWVGVRNYQARNFMRDEMRIGDEVLFYHSSCPEPGIAGLAIVASKAYVDPTQFDVKSPYHDAKSDPTAPRWSLVDVRLQRKTRLLCLAEMRSHPDLNTMQLLKKGNRLSITKVSDQERLVIHKLLGS